MNLNYKMNLLWTRAYGHRYRRFLASLFIWLSVFCSVDTIGFARTSYGAVQVALNDILTSVRVFPNLSFVFPVSLVQRSGDDSRWFLAEQGGKVFSFLNDDAVVDKQLVLDLTTRLGGIFFDDSQQWGITAIALHTSMVGDITLYVAFNAKSTTDGSVTSFVSRFSSPDNGQTFDAASETIILSVPQRPKSHHLGHLTFGPDGYLYIGFGDGSVPTTAQDLNDVRGSILRVDINGDGLYTIPPDNPLVGTGQREEIYIWGLRNPWRFSIDPVTNALWIGDVGNNNREEVNRAMPGLSYGWPIWEGTLCQTEPCDSTNHVPPLLEYDHSTGTAVIGGYVYRGTLIPSLQGVYVFSDWSRGKQLWGVLTDADNQGKFITLGSISAGSNRPSGFAEDNQGELYHISAQDAEAGLYKIIPTTP